MSSLKPLFILFCTFGLSPLLAVDFNRDVRPILSDKCFACHGPDEHERKADLRLDTAEGAFADLGGYVAFKKGQPEKSEAFLRITSSDRDEVMPPPKFHKELTKEEVATIKKWIAEGADFQMHWSFQSLERPEPPQFDTPFVRNDIDRFILNRLKEKGPQPSPQADRVTLIRRLYLDLLGLPPKPEEVDQFVQDKSPDAYEQLVQRLLNSNHFGERMAVYWLDLVRYADTIGYHSDTTMEVSAYRDYVINAFNRNMPYDQFTIEQLAGDLLPNPTLEQKIASGYNRLLQTTEEGGAQAKEYMTIYSADRVRNVSGVWMGATLGCAQCHDHKYDPFTTKDFYSMAAFFADIKEKPIGKRQPNLKLPTPEEEAEIAELKKNLTENTIAKFLARDSALANQLAASQADWEAKNLKDLTETQRDWTVLAPTNLKSSGRSALKTQPDGSVLSTGNNPGTDNYTATLQSSGAVTGLRLEALTHETLKNQSLSRGNGNFVLTNLKLSSNGKPIKIASAKADYEQPNYPLSNAIDEDPKSGWAANGHNEAVSRTAIFLFAEPVELGEKGQIQVELKHESGISHHNIGRFRLSLTSAAEPAMVKGSDLPLEIQTALKVKATDRHAKQKKTISDYYITIAPELADARTNLDQWKKRLEAIEKQIQTMLVSEPLPEPRMTRILPRGNWLDESGPTVEPAVPVFLPHESIEGRRANRLDLAQWIVADTNPLTSRTFVNRLWKLYFGTGLSRNLDDLGGQGEPPTHPDLLDWMAVEFHQSGWDIKHMITLMVTSGTYRQVSIDTPKIKEKDSGNRYYARQGRWRLDAEFVRDTALEISGLLVDELGGKSKKPYQPAGYWQHLNFPRREWKAGQGEELYRRGLYTFWCRTFPHPAMLAFDAPSREECTAERPRSNIPQQALVMLNDPIFVEAARVFATRIHSQPGDPASKLNWAWRNALSRQPSPEESRILMDVYKNQLARYTTDTSAAEQLIKIGQFPLPDSVNPAELAAWTQVARTILNTYETSSRY